MADGSLRRQHRYTVLPEPLLRDKNVSDRALRLWCLLDRYAGANGEAFPKRTTLADDLSCSVATVDRAVEELVNAGWLSKARRYSGGPNDYTLLDGVITHEDTPVVMGDDTPSSPMTTPVLTGESTQKEASRTRQQRSDEGAAGATPIEQGKRDGHSRTKTAMRLPEDWQPNDHEREWCQSQPWFTFISPGIETEKFRNYWHAKSGQQATKVDWPKTWMNWMISTAQRAGYTDSTGRTREGDPF